MLHYVDEGSGRAVVLLHAYPCDLHLYDAQAQALVAAGYRVVRPDLSGFGQSLPSEEPPSVAVFAAHVLGTMEAAGLDTFVLGGLSLGGYVAMEILRQQPERVSALMLIDTKASADDEAGKGVREQTAAKILAEGSLLPLAEGMLNGLLGPTTRKSRPDVVQRTMGWISQTPATSAAWAQRAMAKRPESLTTLADFAGPAVVIGGNEDALASIAEHELMVNSLPDARLVIIEECGHLSAVERPEALSSALLAFLGGL